MSDDYKVQKGDTIAKIAQRIYEANKDVIGDDPNLILPGQGLALPSAPRSIIEPADEYVSSSEYWTPEFAGNNTCNVSETYYVPTFWRQSVDPNAPVISPEVNRLMKLAYDDEVGDRAVETLEKMSEQGKLSIDEIKLAARDGHEKIRMIAATNPATPNDVLFKLIKEWDLTYTDVSDAALANLQGRANKGKLSVEELKFAAEQRREEVRIIAATNSATPNDVLFKLIKEWDLLYTDVSDAALANLQGRANKGKLSVEELKFAAEQRREEVRMIAATNSATPNDVLFKLSKEWDLTYTDVSDAATAALVARVKRGEFTPEEVAIAAKHGREELREAVAVQVAVAKN